jgi:hypothetical protein
MVDNKQSSKLKRAIMGKLQVIIVSFQFSNDEDVNACNIATKKLKVINFYKHWKRVASKE